ncbi:MAG: 2-oxoacid:acceptor oxidoreductase subunit alpha [Candidatus Thorarchaeota archaeon]|nr:2-oxoacid:acceptor oxidoreductase subunit alpha [Candidatus Thorarchaeota archaeon]
MASSQDSKSYFWQGNQACAEGAIFAGCKFFAGYPITPASEIAEVMSYRLPKLGGTYLQMEDEIAAISAVIGAAWGGVLSMTATSGPGFSLMQENIGYAMMTETPCVIVDVQRAGPSTGQATKVAQGDLMQSRWGTHGDHESVVLAPNSAQESYELTIKSFILAEMLRHPVILLSDEVIAHSREKVVIESNKKSEVKRRFAGKDDPPYGGKSSDGYAIMPRFGDGHDLLVTGSTHDEQGYRKTADAETHERLIYRLEKKIRNKEHLIADVVVSGPIEAEWGVVSFGSASRSVDEAMIESNSSFKSFRLRTLWPFPSMELKDFSETVDKLLVPELNMGQLSGEVSKSVDSSLEIVSLNRIGGGRLIEPDEISSIVSSR